MSWKKGIMSENKRNRRGTQKVNAEYREALEGAVSQRELSNMIWFFYCPADKSVFELNHSHSYWPKNFSTLDKLALIPKERVVMKFDGQVMECQFIKTTERGNEAKKVRSKADQILENADDTVQNFSLGSSFNATLDIDDEDKENESFVQTQQNEPKSTTPLAKKPKTWEQSSIDLCASSTPQNSTEPDDSVNNL